MSCFDGCPDCKVQAGGGSGTANDKRGNDSPRAAAINAKLEALREHHRAAVMYLVDWLREEPEPLLAMADGRHAEGEYRYGMVGMYRLSADELEAEAAQELADAINYIALKLSRP